MEMLKISLQNLCGESGLDIYKTINDTAKFSESHYNWIKENIKFNSKKSIIEHFGTVHYYYMHFNNQFNFDNYS